jgi:hypothetical protein
MISRVKSRSGSVARSGPRLWSPFSRRLPMNARTPGFCLVRPLLVAASVGRSVSMQGAEESQLKISEQRMVFRHTHTDPKGLANETGFNHAPTVAVTPNGRVLAASFSGAFEDAPNQKILGPHSTHQGRSWMPAHRLQDFPDAADFDPTLLVSGEQTFLFFSATKKPIQIFYRRSRDSVRTWEEPVGLGQPNHPTRSNGIRLSTGELLVPLHLRGTRAGRRAEIGGCRPHLAAIRRRRDSGGRGRRAHGGRTEIGESHDGAAHARRRIVAVAQR